jgi:hypothetical protein
VQPLSGEYAIPPSGLRSRRLRAVPAKIRVITKLAGFDEMGDSEENAEKDAYSCNNDVGNSKERILASNNGAGANEDSFCATIFSDIEI